VELSLSLAAGNRIAYRNPETRPEGRPGPAQKMTNRRMLKQQYLDIKTRAGVYGIKNLVTGRWLVAGSTDVQGALNRHRFELRRGTHRNRLLSQDWLLHGDSSFSYEVLDMVKPRDDEAFDVANELKELVALWRQEFLPSESDYEFCQNAP
jgi:hypothetical protein